MIRSNMKAERARNGYTVEQVAEKIGVHSNTIVRWENGTAEPRASNIVAMAHLYRCTPEYLLGIAANRGDSAVFAG